MSCLQIPQYRAKKIYSDEYVEGKLSEFFGKYYISKSEKSKSDKIRYMPNEGLMYNQYEIDPSTLEISLGEGSSFYKLNNFIDIVDANIDLFEGGSR